MRKIFLGKIFLMPPLQIAFTRLGRTTFFDHSTILSRLNMFL
jgi:hypothetical protein